MAALTPTLVVSLDASAGTKKVKIFTVTPQANGDTVDLSAYFSSIDETFVVIATGMDAALSFVAATHSSLSVTITELEQDGTAATDWTGAQLSLLVIGEDAGV